MKRVFACVRSAGELEKSSLCEDRFCQVSAAGTQRLRATSEAILPDAVT